MYRHILARDLRRKKTMNLIMLLFIVIASMFIASSLSIIIPVTTGLDTYFDKANLKDYFIVTIHEDENAAKIEKLLDGSDVIDDYYVDHCIYISPNDIYVDDVSVSGNTKCIENIDAVNQKYFDSDNKLVESIPDDTFMTCNKMLEGLEIKPGDKIEISIDGKRIALTTGEPLKDAFSGSSFMGFDRIYVNTATYNRICTAVDSAENTTYAYGEIYAATTNDPAAFTQAVSSSEITTVFAESRAIIKFCYVFDMVIAGILLVVSIVLILIAMVVLRFTILFTLEEEFREIGIMKAIGIGNRKIRGLYLIKYLAISIIGSIIGAICSVPFSSLFMAPIEKNVVFDLGTVQPFICLFSALAVIGIIMLFCYCCTRRIKKFSPIDAIRNGSSGERFTRKSLLRLSKTHIATVPFMALNDILSSVKRYVVMILVFTLCTLMMIIPLNSVNTLKSTGVIDLLGMCSDCNLHISNTTVGMEMMTGGREFVDERLEEIRTTLEENGMPSKLSVGIAIPANVSLGDKSEKINTLQETSFTTDEYPYLEGTAPINPNEIAMTGIAADLLGAKIGDSIKITINGADHGEFVLTGLYQSMNNLGKEIRFNTNYKNLPYESAGGITSIQIRFADNPDEQTVIERQKKVSELLPDYTVHTLDESVTDMLGSTIDPLASVGMLTILVVVIIDMLVAVLMVKSFIIREKGEIATLKSIGFSNGSLILWQSLRIGFVMIFSTLLAILVSGPITQVSAGQLFTMMGAYNITFEIKPLEVYVFYPLIFLVATMLVSVITAAGLRKISPQDAGSID